MAESTLSLKLADLQAEVGLFLGWGRGLAKGDAAWTTTQQAVIDSCVASGLRQFYFPAPVNGQAYDWSFLKPTYSATLALGASTIALPDDFGGFEGVLTLVPAASQVSWPVALVNEAQVRERYSSLPAATGRPLVASLQPLKGLAASAGQRFQLYLFPLADQQYTLAFQYYVLADYLTSLVPYPYGGMQHAETILESCLAIAEERVDDDSSVHAGKFQQRLAASINADRRNKPQTLGYNGDRSDGRGMNRRGDRHWLSLVTVNGVQY